MPLEVAAVSGTTKADMRVRERVEMVVVFAVCDGVNRDGLPVPNVWWC